MKEYYRRLELVPDEVYVLQNSQIQKKIKKINKTHTHICPFVQENVPQGTFAYHRKKVKLLQSTDVRHYSFTSSQSFRASSGCSADSSSPIRTTWERRCVDPWSQCNNPASLLVPQICSNQLSACPCSLVVTHNREGRWLSVWNPHSESH